MLIDFLFLLSLFHLFHLVTTTHLVVLLDRNICQVHERVINLPNIIAVLDITEAGKTITKVHSQGTERCDEYVYSEIELKQYY